MMMTKLKRILLAEDNPKDVELTLAALEELHLANEVLVVGDGAEALDYLYRRGRFKLREAENPAVVLLDLKMPKVDGLEVLRTIKEDENLRAIPIVVLTSSREEKTWCRVTSWASTPSSSSRSNFKPSWTRSSSSAPSGRC
jgi:CheY-like chemotaxis protein